MNREVVVTGFGPFGKFRDNPSDLLVSRLVGVWSTVLPVTFEAADRFARTRFPNSVGAILMVGVGRRGRQLLLERRARNYVSGKQDVFGVKFGPGPISSKGAEYLEGSLFEGWEESEAWRLSDDAGDFLCNYLYYRVIERNPQIPAGFVHVRPISSVSLSTQFNALSDIVQLVRQSL